MHAKCLRIILRNARIARNARSLRYVRCLRCVKHLRTQRTQWACVKLYASILLALLACVRCVRCVRLETGLFRQSHSKISIFYPTLTQKLLNRFSPFFTRCRAISEAINVCIRMTIGRPVLKWKGAEWRSIRKFYPKLAAMATYLRYQKRGSDRSSVPKTLSFCEKIAKIGIADPERHYAKWTNIVQFRPTFHFLPWLK